MKAIVYDHYGSPDVLRLSEIDTPVPAPDEVLVRVLAAGVNPGDWDLLWGVPYVLRLSTGLWAPKKPILGFAVAGRVAAVGSDVSPFAPGDEVYAEVPRGGFAEYVCVAEAECAHKPGNLSFAEAAAVPVSGVTAIQGLRDTAKVEPGDKVLINGASGGVGTFAVQVAKIMGAEVTGVCSTVNMDLVRGLGADRVIDYTIEDFTEGMKYDVILDNVGNRSLSELRRALTPQGLLIPNSNKGDARWLGTFLRRGIRAVTTSPFVSQRIRPFAAKSSAADLTALKEDIEAGRVTPVVERTYPLGEAAAALGRFGGGHVRGKLVLTVDEGEGNG